VPDVAQRVEQVAGREEFDMGIGVVLVLGPDREPQLERKRDGRPVVGVAAGDALLGLLAVISVLARGLPVDRHDSERREQQRRVQVALGRQARDVPGDLVGDGLWGDP
jgi:hypothetical protein